jgi:hypothetical protein
MVKRRGENRNMKPRHNLRAPGIRDVDGRIILK